MTVRRKVPKGTGKVSGFTLMEILIVVGIFSIIAAISYITLARYLDISSELGQRSEHLRKLQHTFVLMERDFRYLVDRSVRDQYGVIQDAFLANNPQGPPGEVVRITTEQPDFRIPGVGSLQRIAWRLDGGVLSRDTWYSLDQDFEVEAITRKLLEDVDSLDIERFSWSDLYGVQQEALGFQQDVLPWGVRVTIALENGLEYSRLFDIANGS